VSPFVGGTRTDECVKFIDEEDDFPVGFRDFLEEGLQPLFVRDLEQPENAPLEADRGGSQS
jgi:hypothetical protein